MLGSREEFESLALPQLDALYRTAYRMAGDAATAEDLVQETMLRAFRSFRSFQPGTNFRAWLFTILTNSFINEYRRRGKGPVLADFGENDPVADDGRRLTAEDVRAIRDRLGDEAARALDKVPPALRLVFLLATFEEMSYKEIAEVVGIPIGTVMSRLFRARAILRQHLKEAKP